MAITFKKPRDRLLYKIIAPENNNRIAQWINWNGLAAQSPHKYRVKRMGIDFLLLKKDVGGLWQILDMCDELKEMKPNLRIV